MMKYGRHIILAAIFIVIFLLMAYFVGVIFAVTVMLIYFSDLYAKSSEFDVPMVIVSGSVGLVVAAVLTRHVARSWKG